MVSDAAPPRPRGAGSCSRIWTTPRVARSCSQHTIGLAGKVISDTARATADPPVTQVLEISDPGIRTSDNGKCLRIECDYRAEFWIRAGGSERPLLH